MQSIAATVRDTVRYNTRGAKPDTIAEHDGQVVLVETGPMTDDEFEAGLENALDKGWLERTDDER